MAAVFAVGAGIALLWSGIRYQIVYNSLIDSFPSQFQDPLTSRYAFPVLVLSPSTPLPLQAEYIKTLWVACVAVLCISLCFFSLDQLIIGCLGVVAFFASVFFAIKSWKIYKENFNQAMSDK